MAGETTLLTISAKDVEARQKAFAKLGVEAPRIITQEMREFGEIFTGTLRGEAPVREGVLRDSIKFTIKNPNTSEVELRVTMGNKKRPEVVVRSLLFGSVPHDIKPKRPGGYLKFDVRGKTVFTKLVRHPGTTRDPFLNVTLQKTDGDLRRLRAKVGALMIETIEDGRT
jgi:hypothetical protein